MSQVKAKAAANESWVYLRALECADYTKLHVWRNDPAYQVGIAAQRRFISSETEKRWVENAISDHEEGTSLRFGIVLTETDELIGMISLVSVDYVNRNAEVNLWIGHSSHRGQGFIGEAMRLAFKYAFEELGLERISSYVLESNVASRKSCERFGYQQEGVLRKAVFKAGRYHDLIAYSILKDEFYEKYGNV